MLLAGRLWGLSHSLRTLLPFALIAAVGATAFAALCDAVGEHDGLTVIDGPVASWFATHRTPVEGHIGLLAAKATSPAVLVTVVAVSAVVLWWRGWRRGGFLLVTATGAAYVAGAIAKYGEHRARPLAPLNLAPEGEPSFPSGHVLVVATIALVALGLAWSSMSRAGRVTASIGASVVIGAMAVDRLIVGAHWLTDVLGSVAMAMVIAAGVWAAMNLAKVLAGPRR